MVYFLPVLPHSVQVLSHLSPLLPLTSFQIYFISKRKSKVSEHNNWDRNGTYISHCHPQIPFYFLKNLNVLQVLGTWGFKNFQPKLTSWGGIHFQDLFMICFLVVLESRLVRRFLCLHILSQSSWKWGKTTYSRNSFSRNIKLDASRMQINTWEPWSWSFGCFAFNNP